jgi:hypothetical protein
MRGILFGQAPLPKLCAAGLPGKSIPRGRVVADGEKCRRSGPQLLPHFPENGVHVNWATITRGGCHFTVTGLYGRYPDTDVDWLNFRVVRDPTGTLQSCQ